MPFTPFHMGAALFVKPALNRYFSVITFGIAQITMDIEPGVGMLTGAEALHGPSHTIFGALIVACLLTLIAPRVCSFLLNKWNKEVIYYNFPWLAEPASASRKAVIFGAFFGTLSHVFLDSLMHHDMEPLAPFSQVNPLIGLIAHDSVYKLTALAGGFGAVSWVLLKWINRSKSVGDINH